MRVKIIDWSGMSAILNEDYGHTKRHTQYEVIDTQGDLYILCPVGFTGRHEGMNWYYRANGKSVNYTFAYPQMYTKPVKSKPFVDPAMA